MPKSFKGQIQARIVKIRFAIAGKTSNVAKTIGDTVKKGELLASLDKKILQTQLDKELADFRRIRASFEVFAQKNPDPKSEIEKYEKTQRQAILDASVKEVELAKTRLDRTTLISPINGTVLDDANLVKNLNITPSTGSIKVIDTDHLYFELAITQKDITFFEKERDATIKIQGIKNTLKGKTNQTISNGKHLLIHIPIKNDKNIFLGLNGKANF